MLLLPIVCFKNNGINIYSVTLIVISRFMFYVIHCVPSAIVAPAHHFEGVCFPTDPTCIPICWTPLVWIVKTTVQPLFCFVSACVLENGFTFCPTLPNFITPKSFVSLKLSTIAVCVLWSSTHLAHASISLLVFSLMSF